MKRINSCFSIVSAGRIFLIAAGLFVFNTSFAQNISTIAGDGTKGFNGDEQPGYIAWLDDSYGVGASGNQNCYIADFGNCRVRLVDNTGEITTFAGTGVKGFSGDGGPAYIAELRNPSGVALDLSGNVYIADQFNDCIRKVNTLGTISTVAGTGGTAGFSGDGSFAISALLDHPWGICLDRLGNLYIADQNNNRIRKVSGGTITTIAGNGFAGYTGDLGQATNARLNQPLGVAVDTMGNVYIADYGNNLIRKVSGAGIITTWAGNNGVGYSGDRGPATAATLDAPSGVMIDQWQNIYIADGGNNRIRVVTPTDSIYTFAGWSPGFSGDGGPATAAELNLPYGVAIDGLGNVFIADAGNQRVREINTPAGINEVKNNSTLSVYPNPSNGSFQLGINNLQLGIKATVEVYNMLGEKVYSKQLSILNSPFSINLNVQPEGIYLLKVQTEDGNTLVSKVAITK